MATNELLSSKDPDEVFSLLEDSSSEHLFRLEAVVARARRGQPRAVSSYIRHWRALADDLLSHLADTAPDVATRTPDGAFLLESKGNPSRHLTELLAHESLHAPFSVWVQALGERRGIGVHLGTSLRTLAGRDPLPLPEQPGRPALFVVAADELDPSRFLRIACRELAAEQPALERVADLFELNDTDLSKLFHVSRQRVAQWREQGVPVARRPKLDAVARLADILERNVVAARIPGVVRTQAPAFEERSILDLISEDRHELALRRVEDSFDWAKTA